MSKIVKAEIASYALVNEDPRWHTAITANSSYSGIFLRLESDQGTVGWGYGKAYYGGDVTFPYVQGAFDAGVALIVGEDCEDFGSVARRLERSQAIAHCQVVVQAFESAVIDIVAQEHGLPVAGLFGGARRDRIPVLRILSLNDPSEVAQGAKEIVETGIRYLKIKLENKPPADDVRRVLAVREAVGPDVRLSVDANQSYDAKGAVRFWNEALEADLSLFEQPVPADDVRGLRFVKQEIGGIVEAHEAARSIATLRSLLECDAIDSVNINTEAFGLHGMIEAAHLCDAYGIGCRLGVHLGPRYFVAFAAQLAATFPTLSFASELGECARLTNDPSTGVEIVDGDLLIPRGPGTGAVMDGGTLVPVD